MIRRALFVSAFAAFVAFPAARAFGQAGDPRQEVKKLFEKVSKDLDEIDKLLLNASSEPRSSSSSSGSAGKGAAKEAHDKQKSVVDSIQKILELVPRTGSSSQGGGGQGQQPPPQQGGKMPNDPGQQTEENGTPKGAGQAPQDPNGQQKPDSPKESKAKPTKGVKPPRDYATERKEHGDNAVDRWGDLPEQARQVFSNESTQDLPLRYRKWIEDFFRRAQRSGANPNGGR